MSAGEATVAGVLAAVAGRWNGYNARPEDLHTAMAAQLDCAGLLMTPEIAAELDRLRVLAEHAEFLDGTTVPELRREIQYQKDGKARWRERAVKAEARVDADEARRLLAGRLVEQRHQAMDAAEPPLAVAL